MDSFEIEMKLLAGKPIQITGEISIHKVSFDKMCEVGYKKYSEIIGLLCLSDDKLSSFLKTDTDVYSYLLAIVYNAINNNEESIVLLCDLIKVFKCIFNQDVKFDVDKKCFAIGDLELNKNNFKEFIKVLKIRNCLEDVASADDNPDSERTRQLLERRKHLRDKLNKTKAKDQDDEGITILDLISIYAESSHMKLEDVFQYDMYQFNNQFNRLRIFKDYEVNIQALLAGAKKDDIDLKHWLTKIEKKE